MVHKKKYYKNERKLKKKNIVGAHKNNKHTHRHAISHVRAHNKHNTPAMAVKKKRTQSKIARAHTHRQPRDLRTHSQQKYNTSTTAKQKEHNYRRLQTIALTLTTKYNTARTKGKKRHNCRSSQILCVHRHAISHAHTRTHTHNKNISTHLNSSTRQ